MISEEKLYKHPFPMSVTRYIEFNYKYLSFSGKNIVEYLKNYSTTFIPAYILGGADFSEDDYNELKELDFKTKAESIYDINATLLNITPISQNELTPIMFYTHLRFIEKVISLTKMELLQLSNWAGFKIAFESNMEYYILQSSQSTNIYDAKNIYYNPKKLITRSGYSSKFIDVSKNAGRERLLPGMKFIPAYKIWFGKEAQDVFGRAKILKYSNAISIIELENGVIEMQLMDDITKMAAPYNVKKQKDIIKYFEIEKLEVTKY
jgi:hypothetical protein